uniref:Glycosyltransferase n=2 Tax=Cajanus cajan TaxID=3821 RepID=A0A151S4G1_CAJCA|nr:Hydroquinone glucosyltransferase [Cajanus cajan]
MEKPIYIVIVPSPGFSHLLSIIEFSKRLIQHSNGLQITCLIPTLDSPSEPSKAIIQTLPSSIHSTFLPSIHSTNLPQDSPIAVKAQLTATLSLPFIRESLKTLSSSSRLVAMVTDLFASDALICAKEFNMLSFIYAPTSATTLSFCLCLPKLDQNVSSEFRDLLEPIEIPGCVPIYGYDLPKPVQDRTSQMYEFFLQKCKQLHAVDGVLVNSFKGIEEGPIRALDEEGYGYPKVYPVGPIIQTGLSGDVKTGSECLRWLDNQAPNSVVYVSFGSGGTLSQDQMNELALGLELSGHKFLWVVRAPSESANSGYLNSESDDPLRFLPDGFIERTKEQGLVVPSWAPQVEVLGHNATGGFLTHCGWNSILESIMNGVPLIAWPLFAEQRMNAVMLNVALKVALRPNANEKGLVGREEIGKVIRRLIEGEEGREIRRRMQKLKNVAAETMQEEGLSSKTVIQFAAKLIGN